jgi:serine/threonine-protein kinase
MAVGEYTRIAQRSKHPPSVIAHSLGSYLAARLLCKYDEVRFDRVIFCGSIVDVAYPWSSIFDAHRVTRVLNECGKKDLWSKVAGWFVSDAGPSGTEGFSDSAAGRVITRRRPEFRHSDFFYEVNYENTWIPFLQGKDPDLEPVTKPSPNWSATCTIKPLYGQMNGYL